MERVAGALRGEELEKLFCSPQQRALDTAAILAAHLGLQPEVLVDLCEKGFSGLEPGLSRSTIEERYPGFRLPLAVDEDGWARHWTGETRDELVCRMASVGRQIRQWAEEGRYQRVACVIHGTAANELLRFLLCVDATSTVRFRHSNCGITRMAFREAGVLQVITLNDTGHLSGLPETSKVDRDAS